MVQSIVTQDRRVFHILSMSFETNPHPLLASNTVSLKRRAQVLSIQKKKGDETNQGWVLYQLNGFPLWYVHPWSKPIMIHDI